MNVFMFFFFFLIEFCGLLPDDMIPKEYITFRHIVPVSALSGFGIDHLKTCIQQSLDEEAAIDTKALHQERLQELRRYLQ